VSVRITCKGQITIPKEIRDRFGFLPGTEVEIVANASSVEIVKLAPVRGEALVRRLRGRAGAGMSTDEILALTRT